VPLSMVVRGRMRLPRRLMGCMGGRGRVSWISLGLVVAAAITGVGGVDPGYSLAVRGGLDGKCAGSTISVQWTAPEGHAEGNLMVMYTGAFARSSASVPDGTSGEVSIATANVYAQQSVIFRYVASAGASVAEALAESGEVMLLAPADVCGECGGDGLACVGCDGVVNRHPPRLLTHSDHVNIPPPVPVGIL